MNNLNPEAVYKLHFDCGRGGTLYGVFIAEKRKMDYLVNSGIKVYFGEVAGKHSEVYGPIEDGDYTLISDKQEDVEAVRRMKLETGYNPVEYFEERNEEDTWPWNENDSEEDTQNIC